jgi:hypothetical protein
VRLNRLWPALIYVVAAVLVHGLHDHHGAERATAECLESCADSRTHLSGHSAPTSQDSLADCPACQFRSEPQCLEFSPPIFLRQSVAITVSLSALPPPAWPSRSLSCRAPPRA